MPWERSGRFKRAKMFIWKSRSVTTFGKDDRLSKPRGSMEKLCRPARNHARARALLKGLRGCTKDTSAKSFARAAFVTSDARALARWMGPNRFRPRLITIFGAGLRQKNH